MELENTLEVPLPPAEAWQVLIDIERIASCIPGAQLTEVVDERTYKGRVAVRLGPVALTLVGQARLDKIDHAGQRVRVIAQGTDLKGRGSTDSVIDFRLEPAGAGTRVSIRSEVKLAGLIAQYGRGSGMIQSFATQLIAQFGEALKTQIAQSRAEPAERAAAAKPIDGLSLLGKALSDSLTAPFKKPPPKS